MTSASKPWLRGALAGVFASSLFSLPAQADFFGVGIDGNLGKTAAGEGSDQWQGDVMMRLKHPIPIVPNFAVGASQRKQGDAADGKAYQGELYYNLFDSLGLYMDVGAGYEQWKAADPLLAGADDGSQLYASGKVVLRLIGNLGIESDAKLPLSSERYRQTRFRAGLNYRFMEIGDNGGMSVSGGYLYEETKVSDFSANGSGAYLGLGVKF